MTQRKLILALPALVALLGGCSSPTPSSSSSSHWFVCRGFEDCSGNPDAVACTAGYCVDSSGRRLAASSHPDGGSPRPSDGGRPCDPLTPHELPVTLGTILGVGKDPSGVTYLADETTSPSTLDRVFVSEGTTLFRQRVTGSGSSGPISDGDYTFSFESDPSHVLVQPSMFTLLIRRRGGKATAMGLGMNTGKGFLGDPGVEATPLTVEDPEVVNAFDLRNLPGAVAIEYVVDVDDGNAIVVTHPADDSSYEDFRVFYGLPGEMAERHVVNVTRSKSGSTSITFQVGSATYNAFFAYTFMPTADGGVISHPDPGTLDEGNGKRVGFTERFPTPTMLRGFGFTCL